jgi:hypothetical protein
MNLLALEIPDDPTLRYLWLERQIVGMHLADLAAQLCVGRPESEAIDLDGLFGLRLESMLASGLRECPSDQINELFRHPRLLLELQERVFVEGGEYWERVQVSDEHKIASRRVIESVDSEPPVPAATAVDNNSFRRDLILLVLAASLLLGIGFLATRPTTPSGWGFSKSGLLAQNLSATDYLNELADAAADWFNKRPDSADQLANRLTDFREGCDALLVAPHPQLADADRIWLIEKCRSWRERINEQLSILDSSPASFPEVREQADEMVQRMIDTLEQKAAEV